MITLRILSRLMAYPTAELVEAGADMRQALAQEGRLSPRRREAVTAFIEQLESTPLMKLQEDYVALFDRGRHLSLHLFEHVHGESRDRGQAMVELINYYREAGLELDARELPDYLPLLLEFLSTRPEEEIHAMLNDAMAVIVLLGARLREKGSTHAELFEALVEIGGEPAEAGAMRKQAATEGPDETITRMDEIWEEEQVTFMANNNPAEGGGCPVSQDTGQKQEIPIQWMEKPGKASHNPAGRG
ncbi:nitrate reductase molybdenum cofactor assembly chaperone [Natronospira bacteriovora]|uniref:Nitrate reductase molybdenum cofactor assembly chaperone n=1 Tax=Natronospira bacteriovora TaxID=3069753 RepID=A0ABU0W3R5_9GAMM|nr:nitrate reductase molybdenum cofactor assembly chaperone [Natronospira sp. AB-CW4]MDQ2068601.1 nitrate reductase molybdenum cofactor assembly chaperone [Natronospira sp. AB-CW4]